MKVIKECKPEKWTHEVKCVNCHSVLELAISDVQYKFGSSEHFGWRCCVCCAFTNIDQWELPALVKLAAMDRDDPGGRMGDAYRAEQAEYERLRWDSRWG